MSRKDEDTLTAFLERHEADISKIIGALAKNIEEGPKQRQKNLQLVMGFMIGLVASNPISPEWVGVIPPFFEEEDCARGGLQEKHNVR